MTLMDGNGGTFRVGDTSFQCFDIHSSKEPQFVFTATIGAKFFPSTLHILSQKRYKGRVC